VKAANENKSSYQFNGLIGVIIPFSMNEKSFSHVQYGFIVLDISHVKSQEELTTF